MFSCLVSGVPNRRRARVPPHGELRRVTLKLDQARFLDLAIPEKKIDIEVDGQAWHLDSRGYRKADDIHRDIQLEAAGWKVIRFWHHDVVSDVASCVKKLKELVE